MRCPDCNKFVPFGDPTVSVDSSDLSNGILSLDVSISVPCAECDAELKSGSFSFEHELEREELNPPADHPKPEPEPSDDGDDGLDDEDEDDDLPDDVPVCPECGSEMELDGDPDVEVEEVAEVSKKTGKLTGKSHYCLHITANLSCSNKDCVFSSAFDWSEDVDKNELEEVF